jgi:hypothetical protein
LAIWTSFKLEPFERSDKVQSRTTQPRHPQHRLVP